MFLKPLILAAGRCIFPGTPVSSNNKTDHHDITEVLLKVALNTTIWEHKRFSQAM
jgi:hypothetical protein